MMCTSRLIFIVGVLAGIVGFADSPSTQTPAAAFHAIGDLQGGAFTTLVKDATRVDGVIYAVGGALSRTDPCPAPCFKTDTPILWRFDGANATLTALPDIAPNTSQSALTAWAIAPDGAYIASQARAINPNTGLLTTRAVRVDANSLTNLDLNPALQGTAARTISSNGAILYGNTVPLAARFEVSGQTTFVPALGSDPGSAVSPRATSADGNVAVGSSLNPAVGRRAMRYVHGSGSADIPLLPGGSASDGLAVSTDGNLVLVTGNSSTHPKGEAYIYNANTGAIQRLGSPNAAWSPGGRLCTRTGGCQPLVMLVGGITADGSVVAMSFFGNDGQSAYFHNPHGWFHLASVLGANGIDITAQGWNPNTLQVQGISSDGTLVFGSGEHDGNTDGFVAEFGAGVLASFNPAPTPPTDTSIVGAWACSDDASAPDCVVVFTADGAYYHIEGSPSDPLSGFERGYYSFDGSSLKITTLVDTNGSHGLSDMNGSTTPVTISGDTLFDNGVAGASRISGVQGTLTGAWTGGFPTQPDSSVVVVFTFGGKYLFAQDLSGTGSSRDSIEVGTFAWDSISGLLTPDASGGVDQNGDGGLAPGVNASANLAADGLTVVLAAPDGSFPFDRVIDPATIPVIANTPLSASGVVGQAFNHPITATNTVTFSAAGLPNGLFINSNTGAISGTPTVGGQFAVSIKAANSIGVSDIKTLVLTIAIPTPVGQDVVVEPEVPEGQGPITLTFDQVATAGTTEVTVIDLDASGVPPPGDGNVQVGGVVFEVTTTAQFTGLIELCFSYAGLDLGGATPQLLHYENNAWVDITYPDGGDPDAVPDGVHSDTQTVCGATTTLSPFAIVISNVVRKGFSAPISPITGFLNTVKGGTTVPLKFEVFVNGVEQTTTNNLTMTQREIECDANAPLDDVEPAAVTGGASLRYDEAAGLFIQNWKVPNTPGRCYMVQMTTLQDSLALTARFKVR